ncbi:MAG: hypothetical protein JWO71_3877 [Candidatus Acidoferrum typicum]|nr:hypothetical protein [Candidatus Acidoferrum typicum]
MPLRARLTRIFLWISVLAGGIGLGAKIFDLLVLAGAWGAAPPASLALMPYGSRFPVTPGDFFQPLSVVLLVGVLGALISGWKTPFGYRAWLWLPAVMFIIVWIFTPTVFWPMIRELYGAARGSIGISDADAVRLVRRWIICDWLRVAAIAVSFVSSVRAISFPYPAPQDLAAGQAAT